MPFIMVGLRSMMSCTCSHSSGVTIASWQPSMTSHSSRGIMSYPTLEGAVIHSDRGTQYTSEVYRQAIQKYHIQQSMNSAGGRCHDNARCESMWARMKTELLYDRYDTSQMTVEELKALIWRYFLSYWNNRRICSANGGVPPAVKRRQYYETLERAA